ncbi:type IV toxin-antitoxin system AbiEi family antitoxin domain-containing protein [Streptomyces sp. PG2]
MALTKTDEGVREVLRRVHATAARQDWAVTLSQLGPAGADRNTVRRMVRSGRWVPLTRGSYWVGQDEGGPSLRSRVRGALLTCGPHVVAAGPHGRPTAGHAGSPQGRRHPAPGRSHGPRDPQPPRHPRAATLPHALGLA